MANAEIALMCGFVAVPASASGVVEASSKIPTSDK